MAFGLTHANKLTIANDEAGLNLRVFVSVGHITVPAGEVFTVEDGGFIGFIGEKMARESDQTGEDRKNFFHIGKSRQDRAADNSLITICVSLLELLLLLSATVFLFHLVDRLGNRSGVIAIDKCLGKWITRAFHQCE